MIVLSIYLCGLVILGSIALGARWESLQAALLSVLTVLVFLAGLMMPRLVFDHETYLGDLWTAFEAASKAQTGWASSRDYFSPIGPIYDWMFRLALTLRPLTATIVPFAGALFAALVAGLAILILRRQVPPAVLALICLMAAAHIITPREPDTFFAETSMSWLAPYNRWSAGLAALLTLAIAAPQGARGWLGALLLGAGLAALGLIKITYGAALLGLLGAALVLGALSMRQGLVVLGGLLLTLLGLEIATGQVVAYGRDLAFVAGLESNGLRLNDLIWSLGEASVWIGGSLLLLLAFAPPWPKLWRGGLMICITGAMGAVILMQNHWLSESLIYAVLPLLALLWGRAENTREPFAGILPLPTAALCAAALYPMQDSGTILAQYVQSARFPPDQTLQNTPQADFLLHERWFERRPGRMSPIADYNRMLSGAGLLREAGASAPGAGAVLALNFSNPFPMLFGRPSPAHSPIWLHENRSFALDAHVPSEVLLEGVDFVILARNEGNAALLWEIYGNDVEAGYERVGEVPEWILYRRKGL